MIRPARMAAVAGVVAIGLVAGLYLSTLRNLTAARAARRGDDYAAAERHLAACWRLPGVYPAAVLEDQLLAVQQGDLRDEEAWQTAAGRRSPDRLLILEALAKGCLATFQFNEARAYAEAILDRQPQHAQALWIRGRAWVRLQQEDKALADFEQAVSIEPAAGEFRLALGELLHKLGHVRDAIRHYDQLLASRREDERVVVGLAHAWQEEGQFDEAQQLLDELLARRPDRTAVLVERGRLAMRRAQLEDAERWLRQALRRCPDHADAGALLQRCLQVQGKSDAELDRRIADNERQQAELRLKLHTAGREPALLTDLGRWMLRIGNEREAAGWLYAALRADAGHEPAHAALAEYFAAVGQLRRAHSHARQAGTGFALDQLQVRSDSARPLAHSGAPAPARVPLRSPREAAAADVRRLCAACHAYPPPETMPRAAWRKEVKQGYDFYRNSTLSGEFPPLEDVVLYYEHRAPSQLPAVEQPKASVAAKFRFSKRGTGWVANLPPFPASANVHLGPLFGGPRQELLVCDTRLDRVLVLRPYDAALGGEVLPQIIAPCHTAVMDLDGDGRQDILVASLGNFFPTDDKVGKVVWLRALPSGRFEPVALLEGVGRVADVQAADFNGDGLLDLIVAVFGWRQTGEILYLENQTTDWSRPQFIRHTVDGRHGAIHVPVADLNGDQQPDFVALISQEHETVVAYLNQGDGSFHTETLFTAPHPSFGTSGIEVVDLDGDHDLDVLLTNGDVLDRPYLLKPYHGVQWLENTGGYPFAHRLLSPLYGASRAVAADFDGDGDFDVAAVSFLPRLEFPERDALRLPSIVLLEQTSKRQFQRHVLETAACDHFSCTAGDWDNDGRIDLAVGNFSWKRSQAFGDAAILWRNVTGE